MQAKHPENAALAVSVDASHPLPAVYDDKTGEKCYGGVAVSNQDRTIVCQNTLNARLEIAAEASLPQIKELLFPEMQSMLQHITQVVGNNQTV